MRYFLIVVLTLVALLPTQTQAKNEFCHTLTSSSPSFEGYGVAHNVFHSLSELNLTALCDEIYGQVTLRAGRWGGDQLIYEKGYILKGDDWESFTFEDVNKEGEWITGLASKALALEDIDLLEPTYFLAYVCTWVANEWKCGCDDNACEDPQWQIQQFDFDIASLAELAGIRGEDLEAEVKKTLEGMRAHMLLCEIMGHDIQEPMAGQPICDGTSELNALWATLPEGWEYDVLDQLESGGFDLDVLGIENGLKIECDANGCL